MDIDAELLTPVPPEYGSASLSDLMPSMLSLLDLPDAKDLIGLAGRLSGVRRIAVLLVDGLGYHQYPLAATVSPFLARVVAGETGPLRRLTTGFPSTTPTSLVSLGTGVPPGLHGVTGFTVNVPGGDRLLTHILWQDDPDPLRWQPVETGFERAAADGVATANVSRVYPSTGLSTAAFRGSRRIAATTVDEIADGIRAALADGTRSLVYGYFPSVDRAGHENGVGSDEWFAAIGELDRLLHRLMADLPSDTAVLVTADHGMINVPDDDRIDVAAHPALRDGVRVIAGEPRVRYVHTEPGAADAVAATWRDVLGDRARVCTRAEAIAAGWFGPVPEAHAARIGDVVVAGRGSTVLVGVTETDTPTTAALRGYHGCYSEAELAIPLWACKGGD